MTLDAASSSRFLARRSLLKKGLVAAAAVTVPSVVGNKALASAAPGTEAAVSSAIGPDGGLVIDPVASTSEAFEMTTRSQLTSYPVVAVRPTTSSTGLAFDLMPNGSAGTAEGNGITWMDVCDSDVLSVAEASVGTARVGVFPAAVEFGTRLFNGAPAKDLNLTINATPVLTVGGGSSVPLGTVSEQFATNGVTQLVVSNPQSPADTDGNTGSLASLTAVTDTGSVSLQAFSSGYGADGGDYASAGGLSCDGAGGLVVTASAASAVIRFLTGGWDVATNQRMMVDGEGNVGIGPEPDFAGGAGVAYLAEATVAPTSTPIGGGLLYVDAEGRLTYRGPSGTTTVVAAA